MRQKLVVSSILGLTIVLCLVLWMALGLRQDRQPDVSDDAYAAAVQAALAAVNNLREQPGWQDPDWSAVRQSNPGPGMGALMEVVHCVDVWHRGEKLVVILVCDEGGTIHDGWGNSATLSLADWKAMLAVVEGSPEQPMEFRTTVREYRFKLEPSHAPRQLYAIQTGGGGELYLRWLRRY